jgi:protein-S-isoprenylcysteine O-methyltransferase Ste14
MKALENRIPPPVVGAALGAAMWMASGFGLRLPVGDDTRIAVVALLVAVGLSFDVLGLLAFRRLRTTVNPLHPERTSALVSDGVYRLTRNPMYVGMLCLLLGWATFLASLPAFIGPALFVLYITRFQIIPEERILRERFGASYAAYAQRARRWL